MARNLVPGLDGFRPMPGGVLSMRKCVKNARVSAFRQLDGAPRGAESFRPPPGRHESPGVVVLRVSIIGPQLDDSFEQFNRQVAVRRRVRQ